MNCKERILIFGASGSGATSLASKLSERMRIPHFDTDDYFWLPSNPPYRTFREPAERDRLIESDLADAGQWVLSGSIWSWGNSLVKELDLAIYLHALKEVRLTRILERDQRNYGSAIEPGGSMYTQYCRFIKWASMYDDEGGGVNIRSHQKHELWMSKLPCSVLKLETNVPIDDLVDKIFSRTLSVDDGHGKMIKTPID